VVLVDIIPKGSTINSEQNISTIQKFKTCICGICRS